MLHCINRLFKHGKLLLLRFSKGNMVDHTGNIISRIHELSENKGKALVVSHHNPDGDAVGSALAMTHYLNKVGIDAHCALPNDFPSFLSWLEGADSIQIYEKAGNTIKSLLQLADIVFCLDFNALHRLNDLGQLIGQSGKQTVMIDHHPDPDPGFDLMYSDTTVSSTAELVYRVITKASGEDILDKSIAEAIYTGIMTDTGSFAFACDNAETFDVCSHLISLGNISPEQIHRRVYDTYKESRMRLLGYCLSEKLVTIPELQSAYISLSKEEMDRFDFRPGDTEGVVNYALSIQGIKVAALFTERERHIRISFRSKGSFAINQIASKYYEGGGHRNAAGGNSYIDMQASLTRFTEILELYKDEILQSTDA